MQRFPQSWGNIYCRKPRQSRLLIVIVLSIHRGLSSIYYWPLRDSCGYSICHELAPEFWPQRVSRWDTTTVSPNQYFLLKNERLRCLSFLALRACRCWRVSLSWVGGGSSTDLTVATGSVTSASSSGSKYLHNWPGTVLLVSSYHWSHELGSERIMTSLLAFTAVLYAMLASARSSRTTYRVLRWRSRWDR